MKLKQYPYASREIVVLRYEGATAVAEKMGQAMHFYSIGGKPGMFGPSKLRKLIRGVFKLNPEIEVIYGARQGSTAGRKGRMIVFYRPSPPQV